MVVIGSEHKGWFRELVEGSVPRRVMVRSECDLALVPEAGDRTQSLNPVLACHFLHVPSSRLGWAAETLSGYPGQMAAIGELPNRMKRALTIVDADSETFLSGGPGMGKRILRPASEEDCSRRCGCVTGEHGGQFFAGGDPEFRVDLPQVPLRSVRTEE